MSEYNDIYCTTGIKINKMVEDMVIAKHYREYNPVQELQQQNAELMARVERIIYWIEAENESLKRTHKDMLYRQVVDGVLAETPQQSLAAIQSDSGKDGFVAGFWEAYEEYAQQLRDKAK